MFTFINLVRLVGLESGTVLKESAPRKGQTVDGAALLTPPITWPHYCSSKAKQLSVNCRRSAAPQAVVPIGSLRSIVKELHCGENSSLSRGGPRMRRGPLRSPRCSRPATVDLLPSLPFPVKAATEALLSGNSRAVSAVLFFCMFFLSPSLLSPLLYLTAVHLRLFLKAEHLLLNLHHRRLHAERFPHHLEREAGIGTGGESRQLREVR